MRKSFCIGILREANTGERRAPLVPSDVKWLVKRGLKVEVESSPMRVFSDAEYKKSGARVLDRFREAGLLLGIKGPRIDTLYSGRVYMTFSHTIKGQRHNMPLLGACLEENITLIDYEKNSGFTRKAPCLFREICRNLRAY